MSNNRWSLFYYRRLVTQTSFSKTSRNNVTDAVSCVLIVQLTCSISGTTHLISLLNYAVMYYTWWSLFSRSCLPVNLVDWSAHSHVLSRRRSLHVQTLTLSCSLFFFLNLPGATTMLIPRASPLESSTVTTSHSQSSSSSPFSFSSGTSQFQSSSSSSTSLPQSTASTISFSSGTSQFQSSGSSSTSLPQSTTSTFQPTTSASNFTSFPLTSTSTPLTADITTTAQNSFSSSPSLLSDSRTSAWAISNPR